MATIAFDSFETGAPGKPPISRHPAFPAVVALWFAALLGLGSLVLPVVLLERAAEISGIAAVLPAASPPLGFTARGLVAIIGALAGAGLGALIARKIAAAAAPSAHVARSGDQRRPISAHDELGGEGLGDALGAAATRRRSLAMAEDDRPSDFLWLAPLPGEDYPESGSALASAEPLDLDSFAVEEPEPEPAKFIPAGPVSAPAFAQTTSNLHQDPTMDDGIPAQFPSTEERERRLSQRRLDKGGNVPGDAERRLLVRRAGDDPLPFTAPSLTRRGQADNENLPSEPSETVPEAQTETQAEAQAEPTPSLAPATASDWASDPLDGLGMPQLVERLGASIEKRRRQQAQAPLTVPAIEARAPAAAPIAVPDDFDAAPPELAAEAMAAYFGRVPNSQVDPAASTDLAAPDPFWAETSRPADTPLPQRFAALADLGADLGADQEDEDPVASFALPLRTPAVAPSRAGLSSEAPVEAAPDDSGEFGSLLTLNPFATRREEFVRVEEPEPVDDVLPPTVVFPGRAAPPAGEAPRMFDRPGAQPNLASAPKAPPAGTDEALRKALATLQRMSSSG